MIHFLEMTYDIFIRKVLLKKHNYILESIVKYKILEYSLFSMSIHFEASKLTNKNILERVQVYRNNCRNILKLTNFQHSCKDVFKGSEKIGRFLSLMPKTEHDFQSFQIDVPVHSHTMTVNFCY